ncbi:MAG: hypothetical protein ACM3SQ_05865 [Betaproteobacteria bacterium]
MLSWKVPASLGSSRPEVKRAASFSGMCRFVSHLPGPGLLVVFVVLILFVVIAVSVIVPIVIVPIVIEIVIILIVIIDVIEMEISCKETFRVVCVCHDAGSVAGGFGFSRLGGGYVDQKWRPQRGHTQN